MGAAADVIFGDVMLCGGITDTDQGNYGNLSFAANFSAVNDQRV